MADQIDKVDGSCQDHEKKLEDDPKLALVDVTEHVVVDLHVRIDARGVVRPLLQLVNFNWKCCLKNANKPKSQNLKS